MLMQTYLATDLVICHKLLFCNKIAKTWQHLRGKKPLKECCIWHHRQAANGRSKFPSLARSTPFLSPCVRRCFCSRHSPALEVEGCRAVVAAQQVSPLAAAIAGVVVRGPAAPPDVSHQLPTPLLYLLGLRRRQQRLDLLEKKLFK